MRYRLIGSVVDNLKNRVIIWSWIKEIGMTRFMFQSLLRAAMMTACVLMLADSIAVKNNLGIVMWVLLGAAISSFEPRLR